VAVDAEADKCAAGDASGRLLIWHGFGAAVARSGAGQNPGDLPCTTVHWHAHPVGALAFSRDGAYLLSGGVESVVVRLLSLVLGLFRHASFSTSSRLNQL